jgi:ABC-2 type transport system permease protein
MATGSDVMTVALISAERVAGYGRCLAGIIRREALRWLNQRGRFISGLVRPLVWLAIFAAGFHAAPGLLPTAPYGGPVSYEIYIAPGLIAMIQLFNGMQSSLSIVYDREMGSMRLLMTSPFPRWFLLSAKLLAGVAVSVVQVYMFLAIAWFWGIAPPWAGYLAVLPALLVSGLMLGALGLVLSSFVRQLENFAGVMNFVIFPMFFASSALYPLSRMKEASPIVYWISACNPFTHAIELIRYALQLQLNELSLVVLLGYTGVFLATAIYAYDPARGFTRRPIAE